MERNFCKDIGCPASCCRNITGHCAGRAEFFLKAFPDAIHLDTEEELKEKMFNQETGTYYTESSGWVYFAISGDCPNLDKNESCKIHTKTYYPRQCINMLINSRECEDSRNMYVLNLRVNKLLDANS